MSRHTVHYCTTCLISFFGTIINWHVAISLTVANSKPKIQLVNSALAAFDELGLVYFLYGLRSSHSQILHLQLQIVFLPWRKCRRQSCTPHWEIQSTDFQAAWFSRSVSAAEHLKEKHINTLDVKRPIA